MLDLAFHCGMVKRTSCDAVLWDTTLRISFFRKEVLILPFDTILIIAIPLLVTLLGSAVYQLVVTVFPTITISVPHQIISILLIIIAILLLVIHYFMKTV